MKLSQLTILILFSLLIRMLLAAFLEFGNDEVYYYTYALHLQTNYFDHPPGVALLIRFTTLNLWLQDEFFVRLGSIICATIGTILSYRIGSLIRNKRTGLYSAILYNTSIYTSIIAGVFILPDSPQVVFWLWSLLLGLHLVKCSQSQRPVPLRLWIFFGLITGLCMLCKVHGVFLWLGLGIYVVFFQRKWLTQPGIYLAGIVSLLVFSPVIFWNIANNFVTWNFHSNRINPDKNLINIASFLRAFFGQIFYNNPVNVFLIIVALFYYKNKSFLHKDTGRFLLCTGLPIILITTLISLFNNVLPHWSGPGFLTLSFIATAYLGSIGKSFKKVYPVVLKISVTFILLIGLLGLSIINFYPGTMGNTEIKDHGKNDFTLDMWGWQEFEKQFSTYIEQDDRLHKGPSLKIVCNKWFPAAHIDYYVARPLNAEVIGLGSLKNLHHFAWLNKFRSEIKNGGNAICIVPSNYPEDVEAEYKDQFASIKLLKVFCLERSGKPAKYVSVYSLEDYLGDKQ
ncbi:MAG: glycosyltransferase family 39 protein [Pyrinomonadaceae bacterium]|nr:glycosyltransferase family 39 protein [Sphingobacteriaceae bacterium]